MRRSWFVALAGLLGGCAAVGMADDGTSVSFGPPGRGALLAGQALPVVGDGYWVPPTWARRGLRYGTAELVGFVVHLGRALDRVGLGRPLAVADLSPRRGGPSAWHRSHQAGRDVDIIFYARDAAGRPVVADAMRRFGADGASLPGAGTPRIYFDDRANWALVRAVLENPVGDVQFIFIADDLEQRVLDAARAAAAPAELIAAAAVVLRQPTGALPHDDHMHVRLYCAPGDRPLGCAEVGPLRWFKKGYKYRAAQRRRAAQARVAALPRIGAFAAPGLPARGFVAR